MLAPHFSRFCRTSIVILETGEEVPADGELLEAISLQVNESTLTGEPVTDKYCRIRPAVSMVNRLPEVNTPVMISLVSNPIKVAPATTNPAILISRANFSNCFPSGVWSSVISRLY